MANQNLSQFTEKTFVADADWTFVWDTAGLISKKVSRNSWLSGTTANFRLGLADAATPVAQTLSVQSVVAGTTNTAGQVFTIDGSQGTGTGAGGPLVFRTAPAGSSGSTVNALGTALTLTAAGYVVPKSWLLQNGLAAGFEMYGSDADALSRNVANSRRVTLTGAYLTVNSGFSIGWSLNNGSGNDGGNFGQADTILVRDGVGTLALRNGAAAQTFNVYGTYSTSPSLAYSRLAIACDTSGNATLTTQSTGTAGTVSINGVPVGLGKGNVSSNVAIGSGALNANTTGSNNLALGANTLFLSTTATFNSALGENALRETTTGSFNVALGASAMQLNSTGASNTAVGVTAGAYAFNGGTSINNTTSSFSVFLGRDTKPDNIGQTNQIVIGYNANGLGSNTAVLGNASITTTALRGNVGIGTTAPSSKLQVSAGDVEVDTIAKGVILKSPDGTRYRVTVANGGTLSVAAV